MRAAVAEIVRARSTPASTFDDGEMSKPSYATYVKDRLTGFSGTSQPLSIRI